MQVKLAPRRAHITVACPDAPCRGRLLGLFGKLYEDAFSKYLGPARTIAQIDGKGGTPSYKNEEGAIRIDVGDKRTVIQEVTGNGNIDMHLIKESYSPLAIYKALVIMALSIMPYNEFKAFKEIVEWVLEKDIKKSKYSCISIIF